MALTVGTSVQLSGNVTTLLWIAARAPRAVEQSLGYGAGRLAQGYWIVLLKEMLAPADFEFDGTTMRSGGREGLPRANDAADALRPRVHDRIVQDYGNAGYRNLQMAALRSVTLQGTGRIAKVIPLTPNNPALAPDIQDPKAHGGIQ